MGVSIIMAATMLIWFLVNPPSCSLATLLRKVTTAQQQVAKSGGPLASFDNTKGYRKLG